MRHKSNKPKRDGGKSQNGPPQKQKGRPGKKTQHGDLLRLYGLHTVRAALANSARRKSILNVTQSALTRLDQNLIAKSGVEVRLYEARELDAMVGSEAVHQGAVLTCEALETVDASELFHLVDKPLLLVLDQITDPHNVGAILRSATAFNVGAVIVTHRNSAVETAVLAKSASGALDMTTMVEVRNLSKAIQELNDMGFATIGLDSEGPLVLEATLEEAGTRPIALVLGSEGKGLRQQTRETCSHLARLDMPGPIKSLNVSNAAVLSLYAATSKLNR